MNKLMLLLLIFCLPVIAGASDEEAPQGAWLQDGVKWTSAPPDINPHLQSAQVAILYFGKDHKFALIYCTVGRVPKQYMTISNGDPRGVYKGEWKADHQSISVTYQLVEATILPKGQKLPGPMQRTTIKVSQDTVMTFEGKTFRRAVALDKTSAEAVYGVPKSSRNSVDQKHNAGGALKLPVCLLMQEPRGGDERSSQTWSTEQFRDGAVLSLWGDV